MATLREEYDNLKRKVEDRYRELIGIKDYDFAVQHLDNFEGEEYDEVKRLLDEGEHKDLSFEYNFEEFLEQIYYNNRHGEERMAYLLSANKVGGLYVIDSDSNNTFFISFGDLNGTYDKIRVIELIEELE